MTSHHSVQVEYKPNNQYKPGDEATANHDGHDLLCDGYLFKRHRINATSINWLCKSRQGGCPGSITIDSNGRVNRRLEHVQVTKEDATEAKPVHLPYTQLELMALDFQNKVKVRCSNDPTLSVAKIFQTERAKLTATGEHTNEEIASMVGASKLRSMRSALHARPPATIKKLSSKGSTRKQCPTPSFSSCKHKTTNFWCSAQKFNWKGIIRE